MSAIKNLLLTSLASFSKSKNSIQDKEKPRILVVSTTGLGDTLWGTPAIRAIKAWYPNSYLAFLTSPTGKDLLLHNPHIDEIFTLKNPALPSCITLLPQLKKKAFEIALIFHISQRPILPLCHFIHAKEIIGSEGINKGLDSLLTKRVERKHQHEIERRLNLVKEIGVETENPLMELHFTDEEKKEAEIFAMQYKTTQLIGFHPGSKDKFKQWDPRRFIELGNRLFKEKNAKILITGNKEEVPLTEEIARKIPNAESIAGKFSLRKAAAIIGQLDYFITNDTGPMHIAFALQTPTIALFSPTDPELCGPYGVPSGRVIYKKPTCTPCLRKSCHAPFCLEQISSDEVFTIYDENLF